MTLIKMDPHKRGRRPNIDETNAKIYQHIGEERLVGAVLETFQLEAQLKGGSAKAVYTPKQLLDRTTDLLTYMHEYLYDAGQSYELAFETARGMLAHKILGLPEPEVQVFKDGKRVDGATRRRNDRVVRPAMEEPDIQGPITEKDAVNPTNTSKIVLTDKSGRIIS